MKSMMRIKQPMLTIMVILFFIIFGSMTVVSAEYINKVNPKLSVNKEEHVLGEPVEFTLKVINSGSNKTVEVYPFNVWKGNVSIWISYEGGPYKEYRSPDWGLMDVIGESEVSLEKNKHYETEGMILYNAVPVTKHLSEFSAKPLKEKYITTEYAFQSPGNYTVKAVIYNLQTLVSKSSQPVKITILPPEEDDDSMWKALEKNPDYGYFIQTSSPPGLPASEAAIKLVSQLEDLANAYSKSKIKPALQSALARYYDTMLK